ncbi:YDG domain-containing protein, partial [uncultured Marinobacter sp.]|uniref:YDG domain-containing protein n=1 Tax=uncultured Marinobacter sp. TaxID=187379 RepID=UPI0030D709EA
ADGTDADNYSFNTIATDLADISPSTLTITTSDVSKTYDGDLSAAGTATVTSGTVFEGDEISGGIFAFTNKNAGVGDRTVTTAGVTVTDGNNGGNYAVSYADNTTSTINPYAVSLNGNRVYDGTIDVNAGALTIGTLVGSETLTLAGTGSVADKHVANDKAVTLGSLELADGSDGGLASNYTFIGGTRIVDITPAALTLSTTDVSKVFDGDVTAAGTATVTAGRLFDTDAIAGGVFAFTDPNVGIGNKTVTASGVTVIDGNLGGNYTLSYADNTTSTITEIEPAPRAVNDTVLQNARATATSSGSGVREVSSEANPVVPGLALAGLDTGNMAGLDHILVNEGIRLPPDLQPGSTNDDDASENDIN